MVDLWVDVASTVTLEGVNVIMFQQSSRYLIKQANKAAKGKECKGMFAYLNNIDSLLKKKSNATQENFASLQHLEEIMQVNAAAQVRLVMTLLGESNAHEKVKQNELFADDV